MTVDSIRYTVSGPSSVSNANVGGMNGTEVNVISSCNTKSQMVDAIFHIIHNTVLRKTATSH